MAWTNRGRYNMFNIVMRGASPPTSFYAALVKSVPTADTNVLSDLTEIATGNGYTSGGQQVTRDGTGFPTITEDDANDLADIIIKDLTWTASGGDLPSDSAGATYMVLTDDDAVVADREVWAFFSLGGARVVSTGQDLTLQSGTLRGA